MWDDLFHKVMYWRDVIWYDFNDFCLLRTISTYDDWRTLKKCKTISHFSYTQGEGCNIFA